ncbi:MAG TPA: pyridoxamine 5'-phosphate oxidase family protein [Herpetosiphonaceae bacterium]
MKQLDRAQSLAVLAGLPVIRLAAYDRERGSCYAVPLAFALDGGDVLIAVGAGGRLARLLQEQPAGLCLEADQVFPDLSYRSVMGIARAEPLAQPEAALPLLARRYGADWGRWRPAGPAQAFRLRCDDLQGRDTT